MPEDRNVSIVFTSPKFAAEMGTGLHRVRKDVAERYVSKGWARIVAGPPLSNISPEDTEIRPETTIEQAQEEIVPMPEEKVYQRKVAWVGDEQGSKDLRERAEELNIKLFNVLPFDFSAGAMLKVDRCLVCSNLKKFTRIQRVHIRSALFQKKVPYSFFVCSPIPNDQAEKDWLTQVVSNAHCVVFADDNLFDEYTNVFGDVITDWVISPDHYEFWARV